MKSLRRTAWLLLALCLPTASFAAVPGPWRTERPIKAVVVGGSISKYYSGNFGQYLEFGCPRVEVLNKGKVGAGGAELARIFAADVVGDRAVMAGLKTGKPWLLFQGGLNSVGSPESTAWFLSRLFLAAHKAGFQVLALSLTPWGSEDDGRFQGWNGLRMVRATEHVVDFVLGRLDPGHALGRRAAEHDATWLPGELPDIGVDLFHSPLRAGTANRPRPKAPLEAGFSSSPYRNNTAQQSKLLQAAQAVPQAFMSEKYRDFDHVHPNSAGHRLIAALVCQQAPEAWNCDCDAIRHAVWKGKVVAETQVGRAAKSR